MLEPPIRATPLATVVRSVFAFFLFVFRFAIEKPPRAGGGYSLKAQNRWCSFMYKRDCVNPLRTYEESLANVDLEYTFIVAAVVYPLGAGGSAPLPCGAGPPARARAVGKFGTLSLPSARRLRTNSRSVQNQSEKYGAIGVRAASMHPNREHNGNM